MGLVYSLIYDTPIDEKSKDEINNTEKLDNINEFNIVLVNDSPNLESSTFDSIICNSIDLSMDLLPELAKFSLEKLNADLPNLEPQTLDELPIENNNLDQGEIPSVMFNTFEKMIQIPSFTPNYKKLQNKPFNNSKKRNKRKF